MLNAIYLDASRADAWVMRARIALDPQVAQDAWQRAVSLNPSYALVEHRGQSETASKLAKSRWPTNKSNLRLSGSLGLFVAQRLAFGILVLLSIVFLTYLGLGMARGTAFYPAIGEAGRSTVSYLAHIAHGNLGHSDDNSTVALLLILGVLFIVVNLPHMEHPSRVQTTMQVVWGYFLKRSALCRSLTTSPTRLSSLSLTAERVPKAATTRTSPNPLNSSAPLPSSRPPTRSRQRFVYVVSAQEMDEDWPCSHPGTSASCTCLRTQPIE